MRPSSQHAFLLLVFTLLLAAPSFALPRDSKLLAMFPEGAQIIAGIEDLHTPREHARLLLVTHNNKLDFEDLVSLVAVDPNLELRNALEGAFSSPQAELDAHLLLLEGSFDRGVIFPSAMGNGASRVFYQGHEALVVPSFDRERAAMPGPRWLVILGGRIALFGTPALVARALDRIALHSPPDPVTAQRLALVPPDADCWSVLHMPPAMLANHFRFGSGLPPLGGALIGADELVLAVHYGAAVRVDFSLHLADPSRSLADSRSGRATFLPVGLPREVSYRWSHVQAADSSLKGSFELGNRQFDAWLAALAGVGVPKAEGK